MKLSRGSVLIFLFVGWIAGCATTSTPPSFLQARLAPEWIASAQRIQSGDRTIYYRGRARGSAADDRNWTGTVSGEILALDPAMAIVIPSGSLTLAPDHGLNISGPQQVVTSDSPAWKHLLKP